MNWGGDTKDFYILRGVISRWRAFAFLYHRFPRTRWSTSLAARSRNCSAKRTRGSISAERSVRVILLSTSALFFYHLFSGTPGDIFVKLRYTSTVKYFVALQSFETNHSAVGGSEEGTESGELQGKRSTNLMVQYTSQFCAIHLGSRWPKIRFERGSGPRGQEDLSNLVPNVTAQPSNYRSRTGPASHETACSAGALHFEVFSAQCMYIYTYHTCKRTFSLLLPTMDSSHFHSKSPAADLASCFGLKTDDPFIEVIVHEWRMYPSLVTWPHQITSNERSTLAFSKGSDPDLSCVDRSSVEAIIGRLTALRAVNVQCLKKALTEPFREDLKALDIFTPGEFPSVASLIAADPASGSMYPHLTSFHFNAYGSKLSPTLGDNLLEFLKNCPELEYASFGFDRQAEVIEFTSKTQVSLHHLHGFTCESHITAMPFGLFERLRFRSTCGFRFKIMEDMDFGSRPGGGDPFFANVRMRKEYTSLTTQPDQLEFPKEPESNLVSIDVKSLKAKIDQSVGSHEGHLTRDFLENLARSDPVRTEAPAAPFAPANHFGYRGPYCIDFYLRVSGVENGLSTGDNPYNILWDFPRLEVLSFGHDDPARVVGSTSGAPEGVFPDHPYSFTHGGCSSSTLRDPPDSPEGSDAHSSTETLCPTRKSFLELVG